MASTPTTTTATTTTPTAMHHKPPTYGSDPSSSNTTFVQADPSTFRAIVQKLTGAPDDPSTQKLPITQPTRPTTTTTTTGPKRPAFKLHERRQSGKNLQINLNHQNCISSSINNSFQLRQRGFLVSPVSPLDFFPARVMSPQSPCEQVCGRASPKEDAKEEERAITEKGFYLHPSPLNTPRGADPPELLPLFPLRSPKDNEDDHHDNYDSNSCS